VRQQNNNGLQVNPPTGESVPLFGFGTNVPLGIRSTIVDHLQEFQENENPAGRGRLPRPNAFFSLTFPGADGIKLLNLFEVVTFLYPTIPVVINE
jgi:hypothetical protein